MSGNRKKEAVIIIVMVLVAAIAIFLMRFVNRGTRVVVTVAGQEYGSYSLSKDIEVEIKSESGLNVLKIENGRASVISATCPDKICVNTYPISNEMPGVIVCLPNEVVVELKEE